MKDRNQRKLLTKIFCWILAFLMVGSALTTLIYAIVGML